MKKAVSITCYDIDRYERYYEHDTVRRALTGVFSKTNMNDMAFRTQKAKANQFMFSNDIKTMGATNQMSSGRCWLFAATNVLREIIAKKLNVESFELSQSYLAFFDKFERINYYIASIVDTADEPYNSRVVDHIVGTGVHDGGQWDMFVNIVKKYGVIPKACYPETFQSSNTGNLNRHINNYLRAKTPELRRLAAAGDTENLAALRAEMLEKTYSFLCACYDVPPEDFDFEYKDKDGKVIVLRDMTPLKFYETYLGDYLDNYVSIIHAPTADKPFDRVYTVRYLGNVIGGSEVCYLNLDMDEFKSLVVKQLTDGEDGKGEIVWFGSDCGKYGDGAKACWDSDQFDEEALTGLDVSMSKEDMLNYHVSQMNHAMCLTGVNLDENGRPNRWKIENSWGNGGANAGYHMASDAWFDRYVYQAVVHKKYLGDKVNLLSEPKIELEPWDPMGSLAD
ncbi:MAG: C1 family peptidase [Eubacteriales bacterium]